MTEIEMLQNIVRKQQIEIDALEAKYKEMIKALKDQQDDIPEAELINRFKDMSKQEVINVLVQKMDDLQETEDKLSKANYDYDQLWLKMQKLQQKNEKASKHISYLKLQLKFWQQITDTYKQLLEMEKN